MAQLRSGYGIIHRAVMMDPSVSRDAKAVYALLQSFTGGNGSCWPSQDTIAEALGCQPRAVRGWLTELHAHGLLKINRVATKTGSRNVYFPLLPDADPDQPGFEMVDGGERQPVASPPQGTGTPVPVGTGTPVPPKNNRVKKNTGEEEQGGQARAVTDLFWALYKNRCEGRKPTFRRDFPDRVRELLAAHGLDEVLSKVRWYFTGGWWFTAVKGNPNGHTWSFSGFLAHYDELSDPGGGPSEYQRRNGEVARDLMGSSR